MTVEQNQIDDKQNVTAQPPVEKKPSEDFQGQNFKLLREKAELAERKALEAERRLKELEERFNPNPQPKSRWNRDDVPTFGEIDEYIAERELQREIDSTPQRYADYQDAVSHAIELAKEDPALDAMIRNSKNPREAAYKIGKNSYKYQMSAAEKMKSVEKIEKNAAKPALSDSLGVQQGVDAGRRELSLKQKQEVWDLAQKYASRR